MAIPANKKELTVAIKTNYQKLRSDLEKLPAQLTKGKELEGHSKNTFMSVCDLLAYLIGWGQLVLKWNKKREMGQHVDFPETGYKWNELGKLAQKFYSDYETESYPQLLKKLDQTVEDILRVIEKKTNEQLYHTPWYEKWTLGRLIQFNTSSPYHNALVRLRKWKKMKGLK
jgi:hypothetical protein